MGVVGRDRIRFLIHHPFDYCFTPSRTNLPYSLIFSINLLSNTDGFIIWNVLQGSGDFTWIVSDYEELVGVTHRRWWGWF